MPRLLLCLLVAFAAEAADVRLELAARNIDAGLANDLVVTWRNVRAVTIPGASFTLRLPNGIRAHHLPENCSASAAEITCAIGDLAPSSRGTLSITYFADPSLRGVNNVLFQATITSGEVAHASVPVNVAFLVTNTNDSGPGSLRQAIEDSNASPLASFRKIDFRIPSPPESGYHTIVLESPLPAIARTASIDGTTQTRAFGDTNPDGPEIFLDGARLAGGDGLSVSCSSEVLSMAVGNFPGNGILVAYTGCFGDHLPRQVVSSYAGVKADGVTPAPNGRGIFVAGGVHGHTIAGNVVSANRYSGIFLAGTATSVTNNVIGLDAKVTRPLGNGASGIYFGVPWREAGRLRASYYAFIAGNYIAFNHDFGIGACSDCLVDIGPNSIFANWQMGIDLGLDGPSNAPTVTSAAYDPVSGTTTIAVTNVRGGSGGAPSTVYFYASDAPHSSGHGDGQYYLGAVHGRSLTVPQDLRGKWVSVTSTRHELCCFDDGSWGQNLATMSSEFSNAVEVK